ncbi:FAD dependent oxidoreductase [Oryctes borbonicus]|uniref:Pyridine nucleotide-disulfide oxidoreductase domain-containing protein 1 n=1 Tax=Oryctes borbonicus TaxID=1629725 RepID=A0A0T6AW28_9SCAR|nr:FAD dependent oxidoreductase [Oryctes borbonicus]
MNATFVIIGGGIAGVTCAETLAFYQPDKKIILVSESSLIKTVTNLLALTQTITTFNVEEAPINTLSSKYENISVIHGKLRKISDEDKTILINSDIKITYEYLCICIGALPKLIPQAKDNPYILGIRDTDSVEQFISKLSSSKRVMIVGNGGIASELVYKIQNTDIDWVIKDNHISATFVDPGAGEFFQSSLHKNFNASEPILNKRMRYNEDSSSKSGAALGPDWYKHFQIKGACELPPQVKIHYQTEVTDVKINNVATSMFPVEVSLTNGEKINCDLVISATGVEPNIDFEISSSKLELSPVNEIIVNEFMQTSVPNIYAAGDVCHANWEHAKHWFPMKLWTQARQMGCYAAKCMSGALNKEEILQDFCFEIFTHTTRLFGYKVILLGLYNGQKLGNDYEILFRMTKEHEYLKLILQNGRLQGAVLIGDTDLEEMCENLILNQLDLSPYKEDLLDPNIDVEDYFD